MKKMILILVLATTMAGILNAQVYRNALGLRLGYDALEITYQNTPGISDRLELTFGVNTLGHAQTGILCRGFVLNGIYLWVNDLSSVSARLKWVLGLGAAVLDHGSLTHGMYGAGVTGQIGVEYAFHSPWLLSLDYRPGFYWLPGSGNIYRMSWNSPSVDLRYRW